MKKIIILILISHTLISQVAQADFGKIDHIEDFESKFVESRSVDIWLPENYSLKKKYPVLYMNDGKMLFDKKITWNNSAWELDSISQKLINDKKVKEFILVGIHNVQKLRHTDYTPQKAFESLSSNEKKDITNQLKTLGRANEEFKPNGDNYLKFLVKELKPYIDEKYSTLKDKEHTFLAGSSMGALIAIYALCEYPKIFGGAMCISTHWPYVFLPENPVSKAIQNYLIKNIPPANQHKIYFDCGNITLDTFYPPLQKNIDEIIIQKGFDKNHYLSMFFEGHGHSEAFWRERVHYGLEFLLKE